MGVSKESFCRLPQLWERVHLEIEKKRTDKILPPHARIHEPISLHGLRPSFFSVISLSIPRITTLPNQPPNLMDSTCPITEQWPRSRWEFPYLE
jgi:hypothetical protein